MVGHPEGPLDLYYISAQHDIIIRVFPLNPQVDEIENEFLPPNRDSSRDESPFWMATLKKWNDKRRRAGEHKNSHLSIREATKRVMMKFKERGVDNRVIEFWSEYPDTHGYLV